MTCETKSPNVSKDMPDQNPYQLFRFRLRSMLLFMVLAAAISCLIGGWYNSLDRRRTELFLAARDGDLSHVEAMLRRSQSLAKSEVGGFSMLHWAAFGGNEQVVRKLIEAGADVNRPNYVGETSLHCAAARGNLGAARALLAGGADTHLTDNLGKTAADWAYANNHADIGDLIRKHVDIDQ